MKFIKNSIVFLFMVVPLLAAGKKGFGSIDSLKTNIPAYTDTIPYISYQNRLSAAHIQLRDAERAIQYAGAALVLAQAIGDEEGMAFSLMNIGAAYADKGNEKKALSSFIRSLKLKGRYHNRKLSEKLYYNMAVAFARVKTISACIKIFL